MGFLIILLLIVLAFLFLMLILLTIDLIFDSRIVDSICELVEKIKPYKTHEINKNYNAYLFNLKYKYFATVVELPFSVIQPLLHNNSPIIYHANKEELVLDKDKYHYGQIYVKLSKKDYKEYYNYIVQKEENKKYIKQTEDTLEVIKLIQAELNRINEEALKTIKTEKEKMENIISNLDSTI